MLDVFLDLSQTCEFEGISTESWLLAEYPYLAQRQIGEDQIVLLYFRKFILKQDFDPPLKAIQGFNTHQVDTTKHRAGSVRQIQRK